MVAIVAGQGLGLAGTSASVLGSGGLIGVSAVGRSGDSAYVNAYNGNLILQRQDELLIGRGSDIGVLRTYNSQGQMNDDNGDNWRLGLYRGLSQLTGVLNAAGSTITRTTGDGTDLVYSYEVSSGNYINKDGGGSYDTLSYNNTTQKWTWTDGDSQVTETYDWSGGVGMLLQMADVDGNALTFSYNGTLLKSVTDASGEITYLDYYSGTNNLSQIRTVKSDGTTITRSHYYYDGSKRLTQVITDLTPEDNSIADGNIWSTTYTYDDSSKRVASITTGDGGTVSFTYDSSARVKTVVNEAGQVTTFDYAANPDTWTNDQHGNIVITHHARATSVVDPQGNWTVLYYDAQGRLIDLSRYDRSYSYTYNDNGDVKTITDNLANTTTVCDYDSRGNLKRQQDGLGNVVERSYDTANHLTSETVYAIPDSDGVAGPLTASGPQTTYYVYDVAQKHLRFTVSPEGRVTEYRYDGFGQATSSRQYTQNTYTANRLPTEAELNTWLGGVNRQACELSETTYDFRGQVSVLTRYATVNASGAGVSDGKESVTHYTYDTAGQLVQRIDPRGSSGLGYQTTYAYDGLGRTSTDANLHTTYYFYDPDGRKTGELDPTGMLTEHLYDGDLLIQTRHHPGGVTADVAALFTPDAIGVVPNVCLWSVAPSYDWDPEVLQGPSRFGIQATYYRYDTAGRLRYVIDEAGYLTETRYDGAGRIAASIAYAAPVHWNDRLYSSCNAYTNEITISANSFSANWTGLQSNASQDRVTRNLYDKDGLLRGVLDGEGYLTEYVYDAAGQLTQTIRYADAADATKWASGTLDELRAGANAHPANNITSYSYYNSLGQRIGDLDGEGYYTAYRYDLAGNRIETTRYADALTGTPVAGSAPQIVTATSGSVPTGGYILASLVQDQTSRATWTAFNQLQNETAANGTLTQYTYNAIGQCTSTAVATGAADARRVDSRYDLQGRLVQELSAAGGVALAALPTTPTQAQIDAVWAQYATTYTYDAAGRRITSTDANGNQTLFFYDDANRLTFTVRRVRDPANINAWVGEVSGREFQFKLISKVGYNDLYNPLAQLSAEVRYANRIDASHFAALTGGDQAQMLASGVLVADAINDSRTDYGKRSGRGRSNQSCLPER